jgi:hypothetical protein
VISLKKTKRSLGDVLLLWIQSARLTADAIGHDEIADIRAQLKIIPFLMFMYNIVYRYMFSYTFLVQ